MTQLVWRMIPCMEDREEICQDIFVKAYFNLRKFRFDSKFSTWLYTIAYRASLSFLRKKQLETEPFDEDLILDVVSPHEDGLKKLLQSAINKLSVDERTAITLYHFHDCTIDEISVITKTPSGTIKNMLFRTRKKLRLNLDDSLRDTYREVI